MESPTDRFFVGLDMSLSATGFCLLKKGESSEISFETIKSSPKASSNDLARLRDITNEVLRRIPRQTEMVCIEDIFVPANPFQIGAAINLAMLAAVVRLALFEAGYQFYIIAPGQLKKFITGSGASQKSLIIREVYKKWGLDAKDDNQADAIVLAHIAQAICTPELDLLKPQKEVVGKVVAERPSYNIKSAPPR